MVSTTLRTTSRKLEMYVIHATENDQAVDYTALFRALIGIEPSRRYLSSVGNVIAMPRLRIDSDRQLAYLTVFQGTENLFPLILNLGTGDTRLLELSGREVDVTPTHAVIDLSSRRSVIEYNHRGAKVSAIARLATHLMEDVLALENVDVHFTPVTQEEFLEALDGFRRIRLASVRLIRPNPDWNDHYVPFITDLVRESQGRNIEVSVTAERNDSLSSDSGIVAGIKTMISNILPILRNAKVEGIREGEEELSQISIAKFVEHQKARVRLGAGGQVETSDIEEKMTNYLLSQRS